MKSLCVTSLASLSLSLPSRERGLKFQDSIVSASGKVVAPFAGAWIEISSELKTLYIRHVAPFAGAWIEINAPYTAFERVLSLPSRERGLKFGVGLES